MIGATLLRKSVCLSVSLSFYALLCNFFGMRLATGAASTKACVETRTWRLDLSAAAQNLKGCFNRRTCGQGVNASGGVRNQIRAA
jgi:hypothetical protein